MTPLYSYFSQELQKYDVNLILTNNGIVYERSSCHVDDTSKIKTITDIYITRLVKENKWWCFTTVLVPGLSVDGTQRHLFQNNHVSVWVHK